MQALSSNLLKTISEERLRTYCQTEESLNLEILARYTWNIALSESFYPLLNNFEVALRNHLYQAITDVTHDPNWLVNGTVLDNQQKKIVSKSRSKLRKKGKPDFGGQLISELTLGFWTSLTYAQYEQKLWQKLLSRSNKENFFGFLNVKRKRTRKYISNKIIAIHKLRNRIFHHEVILYIENLNDLHNDLLEVIGWIDPDFLKKTKSIDRFEDVYENFSCKYYEDKLLEVFKPI